MNLVKILLACAFMVFTVTGAAENSAPLKAATEFEFVGHLGAFDAEGRLLAWEGTTSGDIVGVIRWWMVVPFSVTGKVSHFEERWEVWDVTKSFLLLEGYNAGTTTNRPGKSSVWRSNGVVTWVNPDFPELEEWFGRHMHESGEFFWVTPGELPSYGTGIFRTN